MKKKNTHQHPKFPRPQKNRKKIWFLGGVVCLLFAFFMIYPLAKAQKETSPQALTAEHQAKSGAENQQTTTQPNSQSSAPVPAGAKSSALTQNKEQTNALNQEKTQESSLGFTMNLAGITAQKVQKTPTNVPSETELTKKNSSKANNDSTVALATEQKNTKLDQGSQSPPQTQRRSSPAKERLRKRSVAALPRTLNDTSLPPLFAPESTLWNIPFVGFDFDEIATILSEKYKGREPQKWGEHIPGVVSTFKSKSSSPTVALTLDACGGKGGNGYDSGIIKFLRAKNIPATLFVTSSWITKHRNEFKELSSDPLFEIASHGEKHKPLSVNGQSVYGIQGTASIKDAVIEVEANTREIYRLIIKRPQWFRSGTAYYDDIGVSIVHDLGLRVAGFSIAADRGATLPAQEVEKNILSAKSGDIIIGHMNHPESGTREGIIAALPKLIEQGYVFKKLSDVIPQ